MQQRNKSIEIILRGVIVYKDQILLNYSQNNNPRFYYVPGGHLEIGEALTSSLDREMKEEIDCGVKNMEFLTLMENFFTDKQGYHHELNLIYEVTLDSNEPLSIKSQEKNLMFAWLDIDKLANIKILPENIKQYLLKYFKLIKK